MTKKYNILYVDDEVSNLNVFKNTFRRNYNIFTAETGKEGLEILDREKIDLILTDQRMPEMNGVEFLKSVMVKYPEPSRLLITAYADFNALKDAVNDAKIFQYIQKPWDEDEIKQIIDTALNINYLRKKNKELTEELHRKNQELEKLNIELVDLDKIKFQFLNIISHEIRTPLNGLVGATALLKDELSEDEYNKYETRFHMLEGSVQRLNHFLLLAERITSFKVRQFEVVPEVIDLHQLISQVTSEIKERLDEKKINLELILKPKAEDRCFAEKQLIEICLSEILDNAIKHSSEGGKITLRTSTLDEHIIIEISDQGPGISSHVMKHIFKPFITDEDITKEGMGLDLALINLIVKAHDGSIDIRNNDTAGATVKLQFKKYDGAMVRREPRSG